MLALDKLDSAGIWRYLVAQGVMESESTVAVKALGGGVSNIVLMVTAAGRCLVLKQALPELRVEAYWPSRVDRALREAEALRIVAEHLPSGAVPEVQFIDEENFIYGMSCAPASATLWKEDLLTGVVDVPAAAASGRLLAQMHAIQEPAVRQRFIDDEVFWQLRVDPYYNTTAGKHPSLRPVFDRAIAQMKARKLALVHGDYSPKNMFVVPEARSARPAPAEGRSLRRNDSGNVSNRDKMDSALRHGASFRGNDSRETGSARLGASYGKGEEHSRSDFPTVARGLVPRSGPGAGEAMKMDSRVRGNDGVDAPPDSLADEDYGKCANHILLLDFEVVHWGDPAFDLAFCVNHLLIKSIVNSHKQEAYFQSVTALLEGYRATLPEVGWAELAAETRLQLGCLMLARIDGKSPVEYIKDEPTKEKVRRVSLFILREQPTTMEEVYARIAVETVH